MAQRGAQAWRARSTACSASLEVLRRAAAGRCARLRARRRRARRCSAGSARTTLTLTLAGARAHLRGARARHAAARLRRGGERAPDGRCAAMSYARPARVHRAARGERRAEAHRAPGLAAAGDDRDLRPRAARRRPGAALRATRRARHAGARQSLRHGCARRARPWARTTAADAARDRQAARLPARSPSRRSGLRDLWDKFPLLQAGARTWRRRSVRARPARKSCWEGKDVDLARLPVQTCWPGDAGPLITWGLTVTRGPAQDAAEPRHLPPAGDRPQPRHHALARAPRRRARFPRPSRAIPAEPFPVAVALGADPATMLARRDAGARHAVRIPVRGPAARRAHRAR